jgi:hypothetical protein
LAIDHSRQPVRVWTWVLTLALLALLVWAVGNQLAGRARPEIGVAGDENAPVARPSPAPAEQSAGVADPGRREPVLDAGELSDAARDEPGEPTSPSPRR